MISIKLNKKKTKSTHTTSNTSERVRDERIDYVFISLKQSQKRYGIGMEIVSGNSLVFLVNPLCDWKAICKMMKYHEFKANLNIGLVHTLLVHKYISNIWNYSFDYYINLEFITWSFSLSPFLSLCLCPLRRDELTRFEEKHIAFNVMWWRNDVFAWWQ